MFNKFLETVGLVTIKMKIVLTSGTVHSETLTYCNVPVARALFEMRTKMYGDSELDATIEFDHVESITLNGRELEYDEIALADFCARRITMVVTESM